MFGARAEKKGANTFCAKRAVFQSHSYRAQEIAGGNNNSSHNFYTHPRPPSKLGTHEPTVLFAFLTHIVNG